MWIIPTKQQYSKWKNINKISYWAFWFTIIGLILTLVIGLINKTNQIDISQSPGSIATINQDGDNTILNPITDIPEPQFKFKILNKNQPYQNYYKTEYSLEIISKIQVNNLYLEARATSIVEFEAEAQRTGGIIIGHTGKREGWAFTNIPNAWGKWTLLILTKEIEDKIEIGYNYE